MSSIGSGSRAAGGPPGPQPVVAAFDFGGSKVAIAVTDLDGARLASATLATTPGRGARWNLDQAIGQAKDLLASLPAGTALAAIGASTFGIPTDHGVLLSPAIPGWDRLDLRHELTGALGCPNARVRNDVKAAAEAEVASGALVGADPAVYLNLGTGLAAAIVCGGRVVDGAEGAAGEIGYNLRQMGDLDAPPEARRRLEDVASGMGLAATGARATGAAISAAGVFEGEGADYGLATLVDGFVGELSFHLVNLVVAINPQKVAVGGGIVRSWARIDKPLRRALEQFVPFPPELVLGAYPYDAALVGAITLGVREALARETTVADRP